MRVAITSSGTALLRAAAILAMALACTACDLEFIDVPTDTTAQLTMILRASERSYDVTVFAQLVPGADSDGRLRDVATDLMVLGDAVPPSRNRGTIQYNATWSYVSLNGTDDHIDVVLPAVAEIGSAPYALRLPYLIRRDETLIRATPGADVILRTDYADDGTEAALEWHVAAVDTAGRARIELSGPGPVPGEIVLPGELFQPDPAAIVRIALDVTDMRTIAIVPDRYVASVMMQSQVEWVLSWE